MAKEALKEKMVERQNGVDPLSGEPLGAALSLVDTHRKRPRCDGGGYSDDNYIVTNPVPHLQEHGAWVDRDPALAGLKAVFDSRQVIIKRKVAMDNQLLAFKRGTDVITPEEVEALAAGSTALAAIKARKDKELRGLVKAMDNPHAKAIISVPATGEITAAACLVYLDPYKAKYPSSYVKYAGLHCAAKDRYRKNEAGGGNKSLRCILWNFANSQIKLGGPYRVDYDRQKLRRANSNKMTMTNITGKTGAHERRWSEVSAGHRHGDALRKVMKLFLCHLWLVQRDIEGLPLVTPYPLDRLGHSTIISPEDRGWIY